MGEYDQTIGLTLMGVTVNTYLTGLIMSQFFTYWIAINTTQAGAVVYMSWFYCITFVRHLRAMVGELIYLYRNFANPRVVASLSKTKPIRLIHTQPLTVGAILAITNQMLQSWRIYLFTRNKILTGFLVVTSVAACGMGVAAAIEAWTFSEQAPGKLVLLQSIVMVNSALQCAIDVIITVVLTVVYTKSKTTFPRTDKVFDRLIRTAVRSGFFTVSAVFALGTLFSFRFSADTYMLTLFTLPIGRIYTHTIMDHFLNLGTRFFAWRSRAWSASEGPAYRAARVRSPRSSGRWAASEWNYGAPVISRAGATQRAYRCDRQGNLFRLLLPPLYAPVICQLGALFLELDAYRLENPHVFGARPEREAVLELHQASWTGGPFPPGLG
ncbi:hypothetical protein DFH09DRAFT_1080562 [Mycena vulgaris]|nr:hypothetical protein DFH09DRAFT_1080562 [Mycena vulgaris]